eukprot:436106_1
MEDNEQLLLPLPAKRLVRLIGEFPVICTELPKMLCLMEGGESLSVAHISDLKLKNELRGFLSSLGLQSNGGDSFVGRKGIVDAMIQVMDSNGLADPPGLRDPSKMAEAATRLVRDMASREGMSDIWSEMPDVLNRMLSGEVVFLDGLPSELASFLASIITALGGERRNGGEEDEGGFYFPEDEWGRETVTEKTSKIFLSVCEDEILKVKAAAALPDGASSTERMSPRGPIGPARPDPTLLKMAAEAKLEQYENSSDSDDSVVVGPAVIGDGNREFARRVAVPPPPRDKMREQLERDAEWDRVRGLDRGAADKLKPKGREEWIMVPPKNIGVLTGLKSLQPTNRTFQQRSARGRRAEGDTPALPKEFKTQSQLKEEAEAEELMAEHRALRGPSLVELHSGKSAAQKKHEKIERDRREAARASTEPEYGHAQPGRHKRRREGNDGWSWDRDEEMGEQKKVTPKMFADMVAQSKNLDSKFQREISRNFM